MLELKRILGSFKFSQLLCNRCDELFHFTDDHSRVKLLPTEDDEGSDYINANYMPVYIQLLTLVLRRTSTLILVINSYHFTVSLIMQTSVSSNFDKRKNRQYINSGQMRRGTKLFVGVP